MSTAPSSPARDPIKVYDARWEVDEFDDAAVKRLFEATLLYGQEIGVDTVVLTRDARLGCARVLEIGTNVALAAGFRVVVRPEPISTPQGYFTTLHVSQTHRHAMGLGVTASHNPANYIGVKFTVPVVAAIGFNCGPKGGLRRVREIYHSDAKLAPGKGSLEIVELSHAYIDYSLKTAGVAPGSLRGLKVVLDAFHGSCGPELYRALTLAGAEVHTLRLIPNGAFPTGSPNPTSQGKMAGALELAQRVGAHAVIGVDGDGDRIVFASPTRMLTAGFAFVPILKNCMVGQKTGTPALYDPKVSPLALAEWGKLGAKPVLFRNGHSQIKDYMTQIGAIAAAEESGHYYHRLSLGDLTISGENSAVTVLLFLKAIHEDPTLLARLEAMEAQISTTGEFNYQFKDDATRDAALEAVIQHFQAEGASIATTTADGIDLQGTCLNQGVTLDPGNVKLERGWYSGYLRVATNEKGVVRSYFSTGDFASRTRVEGEARTILERTFGGRVVE